MPDLVTYELEGRIAVIGLNRPEKRNAINEPLVRALREAIVRAGEEAYAAVLFGHGQGFSSGLELAARRPPESLNRLNDFLEKKAKPLERPG